MEDIRISALTHGDELLDRLGYEMGFLLDNLPVAVSKRKTGNVTNVEFKIDEIGCCHDQDSVLYSVASAVTEHIAEDLQEETVTKIVNKHYGGIFNPDERVHITQETVNLLKYDDILPCADLDSSHKRKRRVFQRVFEYLKSNNTLNVDGFIRFRLQDYLGELNEAVETVIDEYLMDKEYMEFVKLLKYFADLQETKVKAVHILYNDSAGYELLNGEMVSITEDYMLPGDTNMGGLADKDDVLLSTLIALSPGQITLHFRGRESITDTIMKVFEGRARICNGCDLCGTLK